MAIVISVVAKHKRCLSIISMLVFHLEESRYVWIHPQRQIRAVTRGEKELSGNPMAERALKIQSVRGPLEWREM